jgi:serine O-acetyltransferase
MEESHIQPRNQAHNSAVTSRRSAKLGAEARRREEYKSLSELLSRVREDWEVHHRDWTLPGFRAVATHRFGVWLNDVRLALLRKVLFILYRAIYRYIRNHYGIEISRQTTVGRRLQIGHQGGIVIHHYAEIGDDCLIRQNVTIGAASHDRAWEAPKLGHGVQVGCGAAILGKVTIGDGARIGPNAVVMTNVPAGATAFLYPPRIIQLRKTRQAGDGSRPRHAPVQATEGGDGVTD